MVPNFRSELLMAGQEDASGTPEGSFLRRMLIPYMRRPFLVPNTTNAGKEKGVAGQRASESGSAPPYFGFFTH